MMLGRWQYCLPYSLTNKTKHNENKQIISEWIRMLGRDTL